MDKQTLALRVVDEQQVDRHYTLTELKNFYIFKHTPHVPSSEPPWAPPSDRLLAEVLRAAPETVVNYHLHDDMLQNREEEELTEDQRAEAWKEYEEEHDFSLRRTATNPNPNLASNLPAMNSAILAASLQGYDVDAEVRDNCKVTISVICA